MANSIQYIAGNVTHNGQWGIPNRDKVISWWNQVKTNVSGWNNYDWYIVGAFANGISNTRDLDVAIVPKSTIDYAELKSVLESGMSLGFDNSMMVDITACNYVLTVDGPGNDWFRFTAYKTSQKIVDGEALYSMDIENLTDNNLEEVYTGLWKQWKTNASKTNTYAKLYTRLENGTYTKTSVLVEDYVNE